ncbi:MAG TPA: DUF3052 domain-containing protein [Nocardioides sp.]|jgi:hypothetical protein|uniref:DUF3052 domain-containing protein n=1 Tax=Nocardioides sp. TaxID=35761 RepID=UPI002E355C01|nr:DUF3052 domain-containing protein [Nocardioides sp.]HEX3932658.1 DUF3052 domain-containing protein [Nocardioides sp.]
MARPEAGYAGTPLAEKLGVKHGHVVLLDRLPGGLDLDLPPGARLVRRVRRGLDVTLTFHTHLATLTPRLPTLFEHTATNGMVWICWPKQAAVRRLGIDADLGEMGVHRLGLDLGWVDVKVAAISEVWSGAKFVRRLADR